MADTQRICRTCAYAQWQLGKNGRPLGTYSGDCRWYAESNDVDSIIAALPCIVDITNALEASMHKGIWRNSTRKFNAWKPRGDGIAK